jgi:DNA repair protein RecO (recombination protein O)
MVKGAFNRNSKSRAALFQNLHLINYVEAGKPNKSSLGYMKDVQLDTVYQSIPFVMNKSAILMYVSELLSKTITEQEQNEPLYDFIERSMLWLDLVHQDYANFPLFFTLELTRHLGFYPKANHESGYCFDMMEGSFSHDYPLHPYYFDTEDARLLSQLLNAGIDETCRIPLHVSQRRSLLDGLIVFMRLHAPVMNDFHSHEVLKTVLE